jgi:ABC-type polysaccharide/polyol phosphate transport system ATPase subunit
MSELAIKVEGLGKRYKIGRLQKRHDTLRDQLASLAGKRFSRNGNGNHKVAESSLSKPDSAADTLWALKDVSFEVKRGEVVGIIGRNGAGKSTLLKILSRITEPTTGYAEITGRIGSLLEVGTGFHPELTGRENIYLNGSILGMKRAEITRKFDEIVAFAEVERFIDTAVKHYSSGMYVRLAFAVAAHMETEILLVDEVLAVGDAAFQKKCLGKMGDVAKQGRTVLFVSHNLQAISTLTRRSILFDLGKLQHDGQTISSLAHYRRGWSSDPSGEYFNNQTRSGVIRANVKTSHPNQVHQFGKPLVFEFEVAFESKPQAGAFSFQVVDDDMRPIMDLWLFNSDQQWSGVGRIRLRCTVPKPRIYMGRYSLTTWLSDRASSEILESIQGICPFEIVMDEIPREYDWAPRTCTYLEDSAWEIL